MTIQHFSPQALLARANTWTGVQTFNADILPGSDSALDIGSTGAVFAEVWTDALNSDGAITANTGNFIVAGRLEVSNSAGGAIQNETVSGTNPTLTPRKTDQDTGIGHTATDVLSLIAGGVSGMTFSATKITNLLQMRLLVTDTDGDVDGELWYDDSENKLKFRGNGATETITSS